MINKETDTFRIGYLGKPHGIRGEITFLFDDDVFDRVDTDYLFVEIDGLLVPFFIEEYRFCSDDVALLTFEGIDDEDKAAELTGCEVWFPRSLAGDNDKGDISKAEIIGYSIIDSKDGSNVGKIIAVDDSTENLLFQVQNDKKELLIPCSQELIVNVDKKEKSITLRIPEGLLEL